MNWKEFVTLAVIVTVLPASLIAYGVLSAEMVLSLLRAIQ